MAIRSNIFQLKRSLIGNQTLPTTPKQGEPIVNLSDGILFFSGDTGGNMVQSDNTTGGYFEVGSNLYQLKIRDKITSYSGLTDLSGKFLSGTTTGFVLADISDIQGVDTNSFVTGFTWNPNQLTISRNDGLSDLVVSLDTFSALTVTGDVDIQGNISNSTGDVTIQDNLVVNGNLTITGTTSGIEHNGLDGLQGGTAGEYYHTTQTIHDGLTGSTNPSSANPFATIADIAASSGDTQQVKVSGNDTTPGFLEEKLTGGTNVTLTTLNDGGNELLQINVTGIDTDDTYVTGGTITTTPNNNSENGEITLSYKSDEGGTYTLPIQDIFLTGGTLSGNDLLLTRNDGTTLGAIDLSSLSTVDTYVTGFTYNDANTLTLSFNQGQPDLNVTINTVTGMTNTGNLDLQGELSNSTGTVVINDTLNVSGDTTIAGNLLPAAHLTYDIGAPGQRWDQVWTRKIQLGTSTTTLEDDESNFTMSGNSGDFIFRPAVDSTFHSHIIPGGDLLYDLGTVSERWNNIYAGDISATGLTISDLGDGRVVYTSNGSLTTEAGFEYDATSDLLTVGDLNVTNAQGTPASIGQGGLVIGSGGAPGGFPGTGDLIVHGALTVYGTGTTIDTEELFVEDPTITINYNPTGNTSTTSLGSGIIVQDGSGITVESGRTDVFLAVARMDTFTGGDTTEYTAGGIGETNRAFFTTLNDIVIRNTNTNSGAPDGKRVLAEDDCLDGGTY